jgi:hypothetical protein
MFIDVSNLAPNSPSIPTGVGVAILSAYVMDALKRFKAIPQVSYYSTKLNNIIRIILSGIGTLGVSWVWSAAGTGHQLLITIPAWSAVGLGLYHWAASYGIQHFSEIQLAQRSVAQEAMREQKAPEQAVKPMGVPQP